MVYLYEQVASDLSKAIEKGVFPVGTRLPSIRSTQKRYGVSATTVMQAFERLEVKGLIDVRPKSGHFVRAPLDRPNQPSISTPDPEPGLVSVVDLAMQVLSISNKANSVPLGTAIPDPDMLKLDTVARFQARAARTARKEFGKYEDPKGSPDLRKAVSRLIADSGALVDPEQIVITNGTQEALHLALQAVTSPGDVVGVESPTYFGILQAIEAQGLQALELPTHPVSGVDLSALEKVAKERSIRACVLSPTYQNPLGFNMSDSHKSKAVEILGRYRIPLVEDDVFGPLGLIDPRPVTAKSFDTSDNVMLCGSFSKTISPGLRLGWLAPGKNIKEVIRQKYLINISTGTVSQHAMASFLDGNHYRRITQAAAYTYAQRMQCMREAVLRYFPKGARATVPQGGFFVWVELPIEYDTYQLFLSASQKGISLSPGKLFSRGSYYNHCLRLSCGIIKVDKIDESIEKLSKLISR